MQGVRRVDVGVILDESSDDSTWEGAGDTAAMENTDRGGRATDFPNVFYGKGRPAELPGGGMPGPSGDEDGNAGALPALECTRHSGNSGGGKLTPPTVRPMRHAALLEGPKRQAPCHGPVCQGSGVEEAATHGGRDEGELGAGLRGIRGTDKKCLDI